MVCRKSSISSMVVSGIVSRLVACLDRCSFCCFSIACSELLKSFDGYSSIAILVLILFFRWFERTWCCGCDFFLLFYAAAAKNNNCSKKFLGALFVSSRMRVSLRKQKTQKKESFFQRRRGKRQLSATAETVGKRLQYSLDRARTAQKEHCGLSTTQIT